MTITTVGSETYISDATIFLRDYLRANLTDPISSKRGTNSQFVMTSYPERPTQYPLVTIIVTNIGNFVSMGQQSEQAIITLTFQIRVWARNQKEKDEIGQSVISKLLAYQYDTTGTINAGLWDLRVTSGGNVDEQGENAPKSRLITVEYDAVVGTA